MRFFIWIFGFCITVMFLVALGIVFLDDSLQLVLYDIPARWQSWPASFFFPTFVVARMAIEWKTIQFFQAGFLEGVESWLFEEGSHGEVQFAINDGTGVEEEFIGWMIVLNKKYIKIKRSSCFTAETDWDAECGNAKTTMQIYGLPQ